MIAIDWTFVSKVYVNHNGPIWWYLKVCLYHEVGALMNRTNALIKRGPASFLTSFTWNYKEKTGIYVPGTKPSPDIKPVSTIMLDLSASRIVTNQCPSFINQQSVVFSLEPSSQTKTMIDVCTMRSPSTPSTPPWVLCLRPSFQLEDTSRCSLRHHQWPFPGVMQVTITSVISGPPWNQSPRKVPTEFRSCCDEDNFILSKHRRRRWIKLT